MNHDDKKKYFELLALKILKEYQNVEIEKLIHDEKTDWQDINNSIGIEITRNSIGTQFWSELEKVKKPIPDNDIEKFNKRFRKNGGRVITIEQARIIFNDKDKKDSFRFNEKYFYIIPVYNDDFSEINRSLKEKLKKLNEIYKEMNDNRLFIFSPIYANKEMIENELQNIINIQNDKKRKFNIVYVCLLHELLVFNLNENDQKCIQWIKMFLINYQRKLIKKLNLKSNIFANNSQTER